MFEQFFIVLLWPFALCTSYIYLGTKRIKRSQKSNPLFCHKTRTIDIRWRKDDVYVSCLVLPRIALRRCTRRCVAVVMSLHPHEALLWTHHTLWLHELIHANGSSDASAFTTSLRSIFQQLFSSDRHPPRFNKSESHRIITEFQIQINALSIILPNTSSPRFSSHRIDIVSKIYFKSKSVRYQADFFNRIWLLSRYLSPARTRTTLGPSYCTRVDSEKPRRIYQSSGPDDQQRTISMFQFVGYITDLLYVYSNPSNLITVTVTVTRRGSHVDDEAVVVGWDQRPISMGRWIRLSTKVQWGSEGARGRRTYRTHFCRLLELLMLTLKTCK